GVFGSGLLALARHDMAVVAMRVGVGLALVALALRLLDQRGRFDVLARPGAKVWQALRPLHARVLPANTLPRRLAAGALWGWLPCGLVYSTLLWASSQGSAVDSALLMLAFGLGTWPVLLATGLAAERITALLRKRGVRMAGGLLVILFGIWTLPGPHQHWLMGH
ncbi:MAG: sulfite exporter TauE/SafE family protein, partial [Pseudomonas sp.]|nr:sulfite exporter TauE/SafE family protein [Pseudomonas sp.]